MKDALVRLICFVLFISASVARAQPLFTFSEDGKKRPTPYERSVSDAVGKCWQRKLEENLSTIKHTGKVTIRFWVTPAGKIIEPRVLTPHPYTLLTKLSLDALAGANVPPMSPKAAASYPKKGLDAAFTFDLH